jgi:hypothetical protein
MPDPFAADGGEKPAAPSGAQNRSEARAEGERAKGQTIESPDAVNLTGKHHCGESAREEVIELMNETLKRLHKTQPNPRRTSG